MFISLNRFHFRFNLNASNEPQTYGLGIKEVWSIRPELHKPGRIEHTAGWPMPVKSFIQIIFVHNLSEIYSYSSKSLEFNFNLTDSNQIYVKKG